MQVVYEAFADILIGVTRSHFDSSLHALSETMDNFEIYSDSLSLLTFYREIARLITEVGIDNVSIRDLIKPEPAQVKKILSAIINFAKFREERMPVYEKYTGAYDEYAGRLQDLEYQNQELIERLEALKNRRNEEEPLIRSAQEQNVSLTNNLRELKKHQTHLTNENDDLKREKNDLVTKISNVQYLLVNVQQDCLKTRSRIVYSPEKLRANIADMTKNLASERLAVANSEKRARELLSKVEAYRQVEQDLTSCIRLMEECESELVRLEDSKTQVSVQRELVDQKQLEVREIDFREQQLRRQYTNVEDKRLRAKRQADAKREAALKRMESIKLEYQAMITERAQRAQEIERKRAIADQTEKKISELKASVAKEVEEIQNEYKKLHGHVETYMEQMKSCMSMGLQAA